MSDLSLTIPAAAKLMPFKESTLRKYVKTWECIYCGLPKDTAGFTRLTPAVLHVFSDAHELRDQVSQVEARLAHAVQDNYHSLPTITSQYRATCRYERLSGVEELAHFMTNETLIQLISRVNQIEEIGQDAYKKLQDSITAAQHTLKLELYVWAKAQADDAANIAEALDQHISRLRKASGYFLEHDQQRADKADSNSTRDSRKK